MKLSNYTIIAIVAAGISVAHAEERTFDLSGFDALSASAGVNVDIRVGPDYSVSAETTDEGFERFEIRVDNGELIVSRKSRGFTWKRAPKINIFVTMPELVSLDISSGADANASGVNSDAFSAEVSSGGGAEISGECGVINADVSSGGDLDAAKLQCKSAIVDASSGGAARIYASESIVADASSGGDVDVVGSPAKTSIDKSTGGSVSIR